MTNIKAVSVGGCGFCSWESTDSNSPDAKFVMIDGALYVFCPECGLEISKAEFLIGEPK